MFRPLFLGSLLVAVSASLLAQAKPERVRVTEEAMEPLVVNKVAPVYPPLARQARIQGTVIAQVVISKTGDVESVQLFSGHPMLAPAALEAIKQWKFTPFEVNGEPVEFETQAKVNFTLAGNPPAQGTVGSVPGGIPPGRGISSFVHIQGPLNIYIIVPQYFPMRRLLQHISIHQVPAPRRYTP